MKYTGKQIKEEIYNTMTVTSRCATAVKYWEIVEDMGASVKAELKSTNTSMYSGRGIFRAFLKEKLNTSDINRSITLI